MPMPTRVRLRASLAAELRRSLRHWYLANRRPLPWRANRDSYRIWVAEIMLQQTRIAVVVPAYERFVSAFPTLRRLASASEDEVLSLWSGLGYYSRARSLHRAARTLAERGAAVFPRDHDAARALPGVGPYTAAAVLSIAYDAPYAAIDGNVVRVLSRLFRLRAPGGRGEPYATLAQQLLDPAHPGDWNQAVMELGETVCTPAAPHCVACPWRDLCGACGRKQVDRYPEPRRRRRRERLKIELHLLRDRRGRLLLERGAFIHLPHLWLPLFRKDAAARRRAPLARFRHAILHRDFDVSVYQRTLSATQMQRQRRCRDGVERSLFTTEAIAAIGRSSLLTKALRASSSPLRLR